MLENLEVIGLIGLLNKVKEIKNEDYRIMQICSTKIDEEYELLYTFGREYEIKHLKTTIRYGEHVPSISDIFPSAFLYENEMHDLFGVQIKMINIDFEGKLYRTAIETPFK